MSALTRVHFRKWPDSDIMALFPDEPDGPSLITSYMHVGQHGPAHRRLIMELESATPDEYVSLKRELESAPFNYTFEVLP
jgi:hypothetical protein